LATGNPSAGPNASPAAAILRDAMAGYKPNEVRFWYRWGEGCGQAGTGKGQVYVSMLL
jgi:hypothetical protein